MQLINLFVQLLNLFRSRATESVCRFHNEMREVGLSMSMLSIGTGCELIEQQCHVFWMRCMHVVWACSW